MLTENSNTFSSFKKGDEEAFRFVFEEYHSQLYFFAKKFVEQNEVARDIVQDAYISLYENRESIYSFAAAKSFLFTSVRNACINLINRNKVQQKFLTSEKAKIKQIESDFYLGSDDAPHSLLEQEVALKIEEAIAALPEKCREIFILSRKEFLSNKEIAEQLNISVKTVENQMTIALKKMHVSLAEFMKLGILFIYQFL